MPDLSSYLPSTIMDCETLKAEFVTGNIITQDRMNDLCEQHVMWDAMNLVNTTVNSNASDITYLQNNMVGTVGPTGPAGPQGPAGQGVNIQGVVDDISDLPNPGTAGDLYFVGDEIYTWDDTTSTWKDVGELQVDLTSVNSSIDTINTNLSDLQSTVSTNTSNITTNTSDISTLKAQQNTNTTNISNLQTQQSTNTSNISTLQTNVATNTTNISSNTTAISTNTTNISNLTTSLNNHLANTTQYGMYQFLEPSNYGTEQLQTDGSGNPSRYFCYREPVGQASIFYTASGSNVSVTLPDSTTRSIPSTISVPTGTDGNNYWFTVPKQSIIKDICFDFQAWAANGPGSGGIFYPFASIWVNTEGSGTNVFTLQATGISFATQSGNWTAGTIMTSVAPSSPITLNRGDRYLVLYGAFVSTGAPTISPNPYIYCNGTLYMEIAQSS